MDDQIKQETPVQVSRISIFTLKVIILTTTPLGPIVHFCLLCKSRIKNVKKLIVSNGGTGSSILEFIHSSLTTFNITLKF